MISDHILAAAVIIIWTADIVVVTRKYLSARKKNVRPDTWIWLFVWCALVAFIEWPVYFVYSFFL